MRPLPTASLQREPPPPAREAAERHRQRGRRLGPLEQTVAQHSGDHMPGDYSFAEDQETYR